MVVEAAVERFLSPTPPIEKLMQQYFDQIRARLNCFERDIQIIAETVALHTYHLTVMPPLLESSARCLYGDERFKTLAEQVDWRVRLGRPLMLETIDRPRAANLYESELETRRRSERESVNRETASEVLDRCGSEV